jgi:hypothetical protein
LSELAPHVFICYSSKDETIACEIVEFLEAEGLKCWISSRDVPPGQNYQETIVGALETARGIVFLFSKFSGTSGEIKKELSLAGSFKLSVFTLRLSAITPSGALRYELATRQWIDIFPDRKQALRKLVETIRKVVVETDESGGTGENSMKAIPPRDKTSVLAEPPQAKRHARGALAPMVALSSRDFEAIRALLAHHLGPIAKVLVENAAAEACTLDDLCDRLAAHLSTPSARAAFLQAARVRLAIKQ